jgi:pimeloyl-ACP methyl ester carboxylesterase
MNAHMSPHPQVAAQAARRPRMSWLGILTGALLMLSSVPAAALARSADAAGTNLTIVLVHGGFAGPEGWDEVRADLVKDGYTVVAPRLRTMHAAEDVATVRSALDAIAGQKILVGHSYGGFVTTQAAAGRSDVVGLVYTAAFLPRPGDSLVSLGAGYAPPAAIPHLLFEGEPYNSPAIIDPAHYRADFAGDLNPKLAAAFAAAQQPFNFPVFFEQAGPTATLPSWYALSGEDRMIVPALQRFMAERAGATIVVFDAASHAGGFTHYATPFTKLIEQAAKASAR